MQQAGYEAIEAPQPPSGKDDPIKALEKKWEDFQKAANNKPYPTVAINGVFQADAGWFSQDQTSLNTFGRIQDGADFRRARLAAKGSVTENVNYFFQMDFGFFGRPTFTDVWVEMVQIPFLGAVRVGQWKQPFSLEVVSSFRYTTFMERSTMFQAFTPFRHLGIGFYNHADDLSATWALSAFRTGQDQFGNSISTDGGNGVAGRVTYLPWYDEPSEGRYYWHLGAGYFFNAPPRDLARFRSIPEFFIGEVAPGAVGTSGQAVPGAADGTPFFVDTRAITDVSAVNTFGLENLYVNGPFSLQAEAMLAMVNRSNGDNLAYEGAYMQAGYFLTGEHRPYDRVAGALDRIKPFENAFWVKTREGSCHGMGAWEVAGRLSYIDLNDANVRGGTLTDTTFGVNWYLNPYCKVVFNWVHAYLDHPRTGRSDTDMFGVRTQLDF